MVKKYLEAVILAALITFITGCGTDDQTMKQNEKVISASNEIIEMHGSTENLERLDAFVNNVQSGAQDEVELIRYTTEGAPISHHLKYNGTALTFTLDTTKDTYGNGGVTSYECSTIQKEESNTETKYVLEGCPNSQMKELLWIPHDVEKEDYFAFQLRYGADRKNEINTREQKLTIDLQDGKTVTVNDFQFPKEEMNDIYKEMVLANYLKEKDLENSCEKEPYESYELTVWINSATVDYEWDACDHSKDGQKMTALMKKIVKILEENAAYKSIYQ